MVDAPTLLSMFRRRIGDTEAPYTYTDDLLYGYLEDAVISVEGDWTRGFVLASKIIVPLPTRMDASLFCLKAHYLLKLGIKDKADRDNFRMVKGRLTLDNTNQSKDHLDTLKLLETEYRTMLFRAKTGGKITGVRVE